MFRNRSRPRAGWREIVTQAGLAYAVDRANGRPYWHEGAFYEVDPDEDDHIGEVAEELHAMSVAAAAHMVDHPEWLDRAGVDRRFLPLLRSSLDDSWPCVYGRFDLAWDGTGDPKLLEYNADCPAALAEAASTQWDWKEQVMPASDQSNLLWERLVQRWRQVAPPGQHVWFCWAVDEPDEDVVTAGLMADAAAAAGLVPHLTTLDAVGWHPGRRSFVDVSDPRLDDDDLPVIGLAFKMYPWEWMLQEGFADHYALATTRWVEPPWKVLLSSKVLLAVLWELHPGHPNLLPAHVGGPRGMTRYVAKPSFGWEGAGITVVTDEGTHAEPVRHTGGQPLVFQQHVELPSFTADELDGRTVRTVIGAWVVGDRYAGLGFREGDGPVTNTGGRFVPHVLNAPASTPDEVAGHLAGG